LNHPYPRLRYVEADELADRFVDFDDMEVESRTGDRLGALDGFVVDSVSGRPYYLAVDSGGWFKSKVFLLPVGHAELDRDRHVIVADLARDRVERFPGFDKNEFQEFDLEELRRFNDETVRAYNVSGMAASSLSEPWAAAWDGPDFRHPDWWKTSAEPFASEAEPSPFIGGRAQPGDVIGVETGGEETHIGDTAEDENKRREDAEEEVAVKRRRPESRR
jgi:hypothetical protein